MDFALMEMTTVIPSLPKKQYLQEFLLVRVSRDMNMAQEAGRFFSRID